MKKVQQHSNDLPRPVHSAPVTLSLDEQLAVNGGGDGGGWEPKEKQAKAILPLSPEGKMEQI